MVTIGKSRFSKDHKIKTTSYFTSEVLLYCRLYMYKYMNTIVSYKTFEIRLLHYLPNIKDILIGLDREVVLFLRFYILVFKVL